MGQTLIEFISIFGTPLDYKSTEDIDTVEITRTGKFIIPSIETFKVEFLNPRDKLFVTFKMGDNEAVHYSTEKNYADFYSECQSQLKLRSDEAIKLVIRIEKKNVNDTISIYNSGDFCTYNGTDKVHQR